MYSRQLASTEWLTIQGGLLGSGLFVFSLTVSSGVLARGGFASGKDQAPPWHCFTARLTPSLTS